MDPHNPWEDDDDQEEEWRRRLRRKGSSSRGSSGLALLPTRAAEEEQEQSGKHGRASPSRPEPQAAAAAGPTEEEEEGSATAEAGAASSSSSSAAATGPHYYHRPLPPVVLPPAEPTLPPAIARLQRALDRVDSGEAGKGEEAEEEETGAVDAAAIAAAYPHEVEEGWVELLDAKWGRLYYHHATTGKTQWERPAGFRGDTVAPAYDPPPRAFVPTVPAAYTTTMTTADAIAAWVVEAQGSDVHAAAAAAAAAAPAEELTVFEEMGYRISSWDRDKRQLAHFVDPEELERNRAAEARRREGQQRGRQRQAALGPQEWKRIREEKNAKKRKRDVEWLLTD